MALIHLMKWHRHINTNTLNRLYQAAKRPNNQTYGETGLVVGTNVSYKVTTFCTPKVVLICALTAACSSGVNTPCA